MTQQDERITQVAGELKTIKKGTSKNGNEFLTATLEQPGMEFPVNIRAWEQELIQRFELAQGHVSNGEAVELVLTIREQPRQAGGVWRDCISIDAFSPGPQGLYNPAHPPGQRSQEADAYSVAAPQQPTAQRPVGAPSKDDQIMLQNAMGHVAHAYGDWARMKKDYEPSSFSNHLKAIALGATWVLENVYKKGGYHTSKTHEDQRTGPVQPKDGVVGGGGGGDALFEDDIPPSINNPNGEVEI